MKLHARLIKVSLLTLCLTFSTVQAKTGYKVGDTGADFKLKSLSGKTVTLAELKKKGHVLLIFWATECVYCYSHIGELNKLHEKYLNKGLTVAAINIGGEYEVEVRDYVKDNGVKYLVLANRLDNLDAAEAYRAVGTPTLVMIAPDGKIVFYGHNPPDVSKWVK